MATLHWLNGTSGDLAAAASWDLGLIPTAADVAMVDAPGVYTVTISTPNAVGGLIVDGAGATVSDSANLTVGSALTVTAGTFSLGATGVVTGGTLSATGGAFAWNGGTLSGATYQGALDLTAAGASLSIANGLTSTGAGGVGAGTINADGGALSLTFLGTQTIDNVTINAGNLAGPGGTPLNFGDLTLGANATLNQVGGGGAAAFTSWATDTGTSLTNNGTIQASQASGGAHIATTTLVNNGLISAVPGAAFDVQVANMTNNGTVSGDIPVTASGTLTNNGVMTDTGGSSPTTFVNNGVFTDAGGFATSPGGWLNSGVFNVSSSSQAYLALVGSTGAPTAGTSLGSINLIGSGAQLRLLGSQSYQAGTINIGGTGQQITESALTPIVGATNQLVLGTQVAINHTAGVSTFNTGQFTLNGVINASAAGGVLTLASGSLVDNGSINVSGGDHVIVSDAVTGAGQITLASGGIAEFSSSVAATDTVVFNDTSNATLRVDLGNASGFKSVIQGFTNGNTIDLTGISATGATWSNGVLTVAQGAATPIILAMAGNYAGATFHLANDGILAAPPGFGFGIYPGTNITVTGAGVPLPPRFYGGAGVTLSAAEGSAVNTPVATFTDSNSADTVSQLSATIAWGDGTSSAGIVTGGAGTFSVAPAAGHTYADEGSYATSIAITNSADAVTTTLTGGVTATEADVLTAGAAASIAATAGSTFSGTVANFTDSYTANTASDFTATISWGDGTSSTGIVSDVNGAISVAGSHTYSAVGSDVLSVTLNDTHGTAAATAAGNAVVIAPSVNAATGLTVLSVSDAGVGVYGVAPPLTINSNSATEATIPGTVSAGSTASAYSGTASVSTAQTVTAGWTSSTAGTATFIDTWSSTNVLPGVNNAEQSYGLQGGPDYANATFSLSMVAAGSFSIAWMATESGTGPISSWGTTSGPAGEFGLMNMVVSIDGGTPMQVANAAVVSPSGNFSGTLSAGTHTIKVMDWSNYSGANTNASGSLSETLTLAVTPGIAPPPPPPPRVYGGAGATMSAAEGSAVNGMVASFTDSNTADTASQLNATIAWGDGTTSAGTVTGGNGVFSVTGATGHSYPAEGSYVTSVAITNTADNVTTTLAGGVTATEADVLAAQSAPGISATAGQALNGTIATFIDTYTTNTSSDFTATINWGDGTSSVGTVTDTNGMISVAGGHTYAAAGSDAVSMTLKDADGTATATANATATVASPYSGTGSSVTAAEGSAVAGAVASFTDANSGDAASAFTATIAWGDGTTSTGVVTGSNGAFSVAGSGGHVYTAEGSYAVSTTVTHVADSTTFALAGGVTATEADAFTGGAVPAISATAGKAFSGTVATFTDSFAANNASDLTATITWGDGTTSTGTVTDVNGAITVSGSHIYAGAGTDAMSVALTDKDGAAAAIASGTATVAAPATAPPGTFTLTTRQDNFVGRAGDNTFIAATNTLSNGDVIKGGTGVNTLLLVGGGTFDLRQPDTLSNIQFVTAQEGTGATAQSVTLRENTAFTVNVVSGPAGSGIVINGAQNHDIINLGTGNDTIVMGVGETANGGGGNAVYQVNQDSIFDTIHGGATGTNTLVVTVGGEQAMGANITGMTAVRLMAKTNFTANATAGMQIAGSAAGGDTIALGAPSQSVLSTGAAEKIKASAANAGALVSATGAGSTLEITSGGTVTLNAATNVPIVKLDAATNLTLSKMAFITAQGSSGADTITASASYQTLTGGGGADTLIGFAGGYDTFSDKASGLNGDTIRGLLATDKIDVTDMAFAGAALKAVASGANTVVTMTSGAAKSVFTLAGAFSSVGFSLAADGAGGTLLTHV